jgi:nucleotide-binding universal stress UspA family protein
VIVAGVDGSDAGLRAVDYAVVEAQLHDAMLVIAHVVDQHALLGIPVPAGRRKALLGAGHAAAQAGLRRAAARGFPRSKITVEVSVGRPAETLAGLSEDAMEMILGRRDLSGVERLFAGSTSVALASRASCRLIIVPQVWDPADRNSASGGVVVGIDGARDSLPVLREGFDQAAARRCELSVIYAFEPPTFNFAGVAEYQDTLREWMELADLQIAETITAFDSDYPDVVVHRRFVRENPVTALLTAGLDADLLVIGVRGRGATSGLHVGGVARAVIGGAECPLSLIARSAEDRHSSEVPEEQDVEVHVS